MPTWTLPTGEEVDVPDDMPEDQALEVLQRDFYSPNAAPHSLIGAMIRAESSGNPNALNPNTGASGLMQLMPATAKQPGYGVQPFQGDDLFNPEENVRFGVDYMTAMIREFGDPNLALMAYNWGPGNVKKWLDRGADPAAIPPETRDYVTKINAWRGQPDTAPTYARIPPSDERNFGAPFERGWYQLQQGLAAGGGAMGLVSPEEAAETIVKYQDKLATVPTSPRIRKFFGAKDWSSAVDALAEAPVEIISTITAESLAQFGPVLGAAIPAMVLGPAGPIGVVGTGSFAIEAGGKIVETLQEAGVNLSDAASVKAAFENPELMSKARELAVRKGLPIALFDAVSMGLAGAVFRVGRKVGGKVVAGAGELGFQMGMGGAGEAAGELAAGEDLSPPNILAEMLGEIGGTPIETGISLATRRAPLDLTDEVPLDLTYAVGRTPHGPPVDAPPLLLMELQQLGPQGRGDAAFLGTWSELKNAAPPPAPPTARAPLDLTPQMETPDYQGRIYDAAEMKIHTAGAWRAISENNPIEYPHLVAAARAVEKLGGTVTRAEMPRLMELVGRAKFSGVAPDRAILDAALNFVGKKPNFVISRYNANGSAAPLPFYDPVYERVQASTMTSATPERWLKYMRGAGADDDYLNFVAHRMVEDASESGRRKDESYRSRTGSRRAYTKEEVLQQLAINQLEIKEVGSPTAEQLSDRLDKIAAKIDELTLERTRTLKNLRGIADKKTISQLNQIDAKMAELNAWLTRATAAGPHYADYQLGEGLGAKNYRELHISAPIQKPSARWNNWLDGHANFNTIENPIVRLRFNERRTPEGKRVFFIEELQPPTKAGFAQMPKYFQNNWTSIGFKRALFWAAQHGFDYIGWTTGDQQADRYHLDEENNIDYFLLRDGQVEIQENGQFTQVNFSTLPTEVQNGLNAAPDYPAYTYETPKQAIKHWSSPTQKKAWPRNLYDKHVTGIAAKIGRAFKTTPTTIKIIISPETQTWEPVHGMAITPELRQSLMSRGLEFKSLTRKAEAHKEDIENLVRAEWQRIAPSVNLRLLQPNPHRGWAGMHSGALVYVTLDPNAVETLYHEVSHHFWETNTVTDSEKEIIRRARPRLMELVRDYLNANPEVAGSNPDLVRWNINTIMSEMQNSDTELFAYASGMYNDMRRQGKSPNNWPRAIRPILERIYNLLNRIRSRLAGLGFRTPEDVFQDVVSGEMESRLQAAVFSESTPWRSVRAAEMAYQLGTDNAEFQKWFEGSVVTDAMGRPEAVYMPTPFGVDVAHTAPGILGPGTYLYDMGTAAGEHLQALPWSAEYVGAELSPAVYPVAAVIKNPLYANTPPTAEQRQWLVRRFQTLASLDDERLPGLIDRINTAETWQDFIESASEPLKMAVGMVARKEGRDGIRFTNMYGDSGWFFLGPKDNVRPLMSGWSRRHYAIQRLPNGDPLNLQSPGDLSKLGDWLHAPRTLAQLDANFAPVYLVAEAMRHLQSTITDMAASHAVYYGALKTPERVKVDQVMELARLQGMKLAPNPQGHIVMANQTRTTDLTHTGQVVRITDPATVHAAMEMQTMGEKIWDALRDAFMADQPDIGASIPGQNQVIPWNPAFTVPQLQQIVNGLLQGLPPAAQRTPREAAIFDEAMRIDEIRKTLERIEQIRNAYTYVPFSRFGEWGVVIEDPQGNVVHFETFEGQQFRREAHPSPGKIAERLRELAGRYPNARVRRAPPANVTVNPQTGAWVENGTGRIVPVSEGDAVFKMTYDNVLRMAGNPLMAMDLLIGQLSSNNQVLYDQLRRSIETLVKTRGFASHLRNAAMTPGYSSDFRRAWAMYAVGAAGFAARQTYGNRLNKAAAAIPNTKLRLKEYAMRYRDYVMSPTEEWTKVRGLAFTYWLGGNLSSALIQLTSLPLYSLPRMSMFTSTPKATAALTKSFKDGLKSLRIMLAVLRKGQQPTGWTYFDPRFPGIFDHYTPHERDVIKQSFAQGLLKPLLMIQQSGLIPMTGSNLPYNTVNTWQKIQTRLAAWFGLMETLARLTQFMATYRLAQQDPNVMRKAQQVFGNEPLWRQQHPGTAPTPFDFSRYMLDDIMAVFDKTNRARIERGVGAVALQFATWIKQILATMAMDAVKRGKEGKKAFAMMCLFLFLSAGMWGLPGSEDLRDIAEAAAGAAGFKLDIDAELRLFWKERFDWDPTVGDAIMRGGLRWAGIDASRRIGLGRLPGSNQLGVLFGDQDAAQLLGPAGASFLAPFAAFGKRLAGGEDAFGASREFMPAMLRNLMDTRAWEHGYYTRSGKRLLNEVDTPDRIVRGLLGFMPTTVARTQELARAEQRAEERLGPKDRFQNRLVRLSVEQAEAFYSNDVERLRKAREKVEALQKEVRDYNHGKDPGEQVWIDPSTVLKNVMFNMSPINRSWMGVPAQKQEAIRRLEEAYPAGADNDRKWKW